MTTRLTAFIVVCFLSLSAGADGQVSGFIHRFGGEVLMTLNSTTGAYYRLQSQDSDSLKTLAKLNPGDFVMMTGKISYAQGMVDVNTIDFVGLRQIIGFWSTRSRGRVMNFRSYSDLSIHDMILQTNDDDGPKSSRKQMKYTVVPAEGKDWVMFLSDERETQMGYLNLSASEATIRLVHSSTGETTNVLQLQKITE